MAHRESAARHADSVRFSPLDNTATVTLPPSKPSTLRAICLHKSLARKASVVLLIFVVSSLAAALALVFTLADRSNASTANRTLLNKTAVTSMDTSNYSQSPTFTVSSTIETTAISLSTASTLPETSTQTIENLASCTEGHFTCPSGQCVPVSAVCDEDYDCLDKGDEANCPDCAGFRCHSNNICLWDRMASRCNQVLDCEDLSDEINCTRRPGWHVCTNGVQISSSSFCDGLDDCGDNSDEESCICRETTHFSCSDSRGRCIPAAWVCDGHPDCQNGTDEKICDKCQEGYFQCADYTCVDATLRCDGKVDCVMSGTDEDGCVAITSNKELHVMIANNMFLVCSLGWTDQHSAWVCQTLHSSGVQFWRSQYSTSAESKFAVIELSSGGLTSLQFNLSDACPTGASISIACLDQGCGRRKLDVLDSFVGGGNLASPGKWPWVVSIVYLGKPVCAGVLLSSRWLLTAAHCIMFQDDGHSDPSQQPLYFTVTAGTVVISGNISNQELRPKVVKISRIVLHPKRTLLASGGVDWDMALLQLQVDLPLTDLIQPICLPTQGQLFPPSSICYLAGWGLLSFRQIRGTTHLREARMQLWTESRCSSNTVVGESQVNINSTLCAGYISGRPTACQGDSGGPLMCMVNDRYLLAGIISRGSNSCGQFSPVRHSNRFARVAMASDWIWETMNQTS